MMGRRAIVGLVAILIMASTGLAQPSLLQQATNAFNSAQQAEKVLNEKSQSQQSRADVLKVINAYQRVYLITPKTSYADDALLAIARLYESINDNHNAVKTLKFLVNEYPQSPYRKSAEREIATLSAGDEAAPTVAAVPDTGATDSKDSKDVLKTVARIETKPGEKVSVDNIRYWPAEKSLRVVVDLSGEVRFKQGEVKSPNRVYIDIANAHLNPSLASKEWPVESGLLQKIRVGQFDAGTVRVVLDLTTMLRATSFTLRDPDRLIIDVVGDSESVVPSAVEPNATPKRAITESAPTVAPAPPAMTVSHTPSVSSTSVPASMTSTALPAAKESRTPPVTTTAAPPAKTISPAPPPTAESAAATKGAAATIAETTSSAPSSTVTPSVTTTTTAPSGEKLSRTSSASTAVASPAPVAAASTTDKARAPTSTAPSGAPASVASVPPTEKSSRTSPANTATSSSAAIAAAPSAEKTLRNSSSTATAAPPAAKETRTTTSTATPPPASTVAAVPAVVMPPPATADPTAEVRVPDIKAENKVGELVPQMASTAKPTSLGNRTLIRSLGLKVSRVVIDAGHGGKDTGSIGPTGYSEKDLVLDVAKRLKALIETEIGAEVVMTRNDDTFVPLETRTAIANQQDADLFISIHANSSKTKTVRGVETFFLNFTTSKEALDTASRENAGSDKSVHELSDLVKQIVLTEKVTESRELAQRVQTAMSKAKGTGPDRGVKQAPFLVLIGATMPSILAEISFISNPDEEKVLRTPAYRQHLAEYLLEGVRSYADTLSGIKTASTVERN
jgi:N-acetylmuramoyl-L-alanine amidase